VMHDPLAVVSLMRDVCRFERRFVKVDLTEKRGAAKVSEQEREGYHAINVATAVDREAFYQTVRAILL